MKKFFYIIFTFSFLIISIHSWEFSTKEKNYYEILGVNENADEK